MDGTNDLPPPAPANDNADPLRRADTGLAELYRLRRELLAADTRCGPEGACEGCFRRGAVRRLTRGCRAILIPLSTFEEPLLQLADHKRGPPGFPLIHLH